MINFLVLFFVPEIDIIDQAKVVIHLFTLIQKLSIECLFYTSYFLGFGDNKANKTDEVSTLYLKFNLTVTLFLPRIFSLLN